MHCRLGSRLMRKTITCYLIRHGRTRGNLEKRYIGRNIDESLSSAGRRELLQLKKEYPHELQEVTRHHPTVVTSPMKRAIETADLLFPGADLIREPRIEEMDFGIFEGKNYQELSGDLRYQAWISSFCREKILEGESMEEFCRRSYLGFSSRVLEVAKADPSGNAPLIFLCHGGTIMAVLSRLTGEDYYSFQVGNGDGFCIEIGVNEDELTAISYHRLLFGVPS